MREKSYVVITHGWLRGEIGVIEHRISTHRFAVNVGGCVLRFARFEIERLKPRQRRDYRNSQRGH
ncbi:MAG TPA: hypothetical protein VGB98_25760 [Pyrinomonadaceae bacterium]|jgi:hypothetical protein